MRTRRPKRATPKSNRRGHLRTQCKRLHHRHLRQRCPACRADCQDLGAVPPPFGPERGLAISPVPATPCVEPIEPARRHPSGVLQLAPPRGRKFEPMPPNRTSFPSRRSSVGTHGPGRSASSPVARWPRCRCKTDAAASQTVRPHAGAWERGRTPASTSHAERHQSYRHFLPKCRKGGDTGRSFSPQIHNILRPAESRLQYTQFGRQGPILAGWPYTTPCGSLTSRPQYHAFSPVSPLSPAHPGVGVFTQEANFRLVLVLVVVLVLELVPRAPRLGHWGSEFGHCLELAPCDLGPPAFLKRRARTATARPAARRPVRCVSLWSAAQSAALDSTGAAPENISALNEALGAALPARAGRIHSGAPRPHSQRLPLGTNAPRCPPLVEPSAAHPTPRDPRPGGMGASPYPVHHVHRVHHVPAPWRPHRPTPHDPKQKRTEQG